jgi:hypothetical protein
MGGFGSGRPRSADKIEDHRVLDVSAMRKAGCFAGPRLGSWQWSRDEQVVASIRYRHENDILHLDYRFRSAGGDWQEVTETILIHWRACRFGGRRPYFVCPGVRNGPPCAKSVTKLIGASKRFLCRHCYGLGYASQSEDPFDRALRKANRLRRRLDRSAWGQYCLPGRPRGMWRKTYCRHIGAILALDEFADEKLALFASRLLKFGDV